MGGSQSPHSFLKDVMKHTDVLVIEYVDSTSYIIRSWEHVSKETKGIYISGGVEKIVCRFNTDLLVSYVSAQILEYVKQLGTEKHIKAFEYFIESMRKAEYEYIDG